MDIIECPIGILNGFQKETEKYVEEKNGFLHREKNAQRSRGEK